MMRQGPFLIDSIGLAGRQSGSLGFVNPLSFLSCKPEQLFSWSLRKRAQPRRPFELDSAGRLVAYVNARERPAP